MSHHCHATGCATSCPPRMLMCRKHWFMVPPRLQEAVWRHYRPGQCDDKNPSREWHEAADAAIGYVAIREGHRLSVNQVTALRELGYEVERLPSGKMTVVVGKRVVANPKQGRLF